MCTLNPLSLSPIVIVSMLFAVAPERASAQRSSYTVTPLASPSGGVSVARGLNNSGHVAGRAGSTAATYMRPALWKDGKLEIGLQTPLDEEYAGAFGINDAGDVVGSANTETVLAPFWWTRQGNAQRLPLLPGFQGGQAFAINTRGDIVGYASGTQGNRAIIWNRKGNTLEPQVLERGERAMDISDSGLVAGIFVDDSGRTRACFWSKDGNLHDLGTLPGDVSSEAVAINNAGDIAGFSTGKDGKARSFVWTRESGMQSLGFLPGGDQSRALDISDSGYVVGTSTSSLGDRAFIWTKQDGMADLNLTTTSDQQFHLTEAHGINNRGQIVAFGLDRLTDHDDERPGRVFLLTRSGNRPE